MSIFEKTLGEYIFILIIVLLFVMIYQKITCFKSESAKEHMINVQYDKNVTWNRNKCEYVMNDTLKNELIDNGIIKSTTDWNLYFPCAYDEIDKEINQMPIIQGAKYFIIDNADNMVAKELLWKYVAEHYGLNKAQTLLPNSYILYDDNDVVRFNNEYDKNKLYIMKKNIQRQEGLKISNDKNEIAEGYKKGYVVVQELLQDPYLISKRKTNMRFYVLVMCYNNETNVFVHRNGFMYYTKVPFVKNNDSVDVNITTGYIERKIYEENPLTLEDLRIYLDDENRNDLLPIEKNIRKQNLKISEIYFERIHNLLKEIFIAFIGKICINQKFSNNVIFQLFGVDVATNDQLNPMIMEINKGPDLGAKDKRDSELKHKVVRDILNIIGAIKYEENEKQQFVKILDVKNGKIFQ